MPKINDLIKYAPDNGAGEGGEPVQNTENQPTVNDTAKTIEGLVALVTKNTEELAALKELLAKGNVAQQPNSTDKAEVKPVENKGPIDMNTLLTQIKEVVVSTVTEKLGLAEKQSVEQTLAPEQKERLKKIPGYENFTAEQIKAIVGVVDVYVKKSPSLPNVGNEANQTSTSYKQANEARKKGVR